MSNISQRATFPNEMTATMSGSFVTIGSPLTSNPVIMIFDNQSTVAVAISIDGVNTWRTFPAGEALVIDFRGNHGIATNWTPDIGTQFWGNGASGTFSISYLGAQ